MITNTIADNIISGKFKSPYMPLGNDEYPQEDAVYVDLRITGTGWTKREKEGEIIDIDRPFEQFSDKVFLDSCLGIPITISHPEENVHSGNYKDEVIGSIVKSYIKGKEIWGIGKIYDPRFFETIKQGIKSTSPSVISNDIKQDDGTYKEDFLNINHLAIVPEGHWDGVASTKPAIRMDEKQRGDKIMTIQSDLLARVEGLTNKIDTLLASQPTLKLDEEEKKEKDDAAMKIDEAASDEPPTAMRAEGKDDIKKDEEGEKEQEKEKKDEADEEKEPKDDACADAKKDEDEDKKSEKDDIAKRLDALEAAQKEMNAVNKDAAKKDAAKLYMDAADETDKIALHNDLLNCFTSKKDIKIPKMDGLSSVGYMSLALNANKSFVNQKYHPLLTQKLDSGYKSILKEAFCEMIGNIKAETLKQDTSNKTVMPDGSIIYNSGLLYPKR